MSGPTGRGAAKRCVHTVYYVQRYESSEGRRVLKKRFELRSLWQHGARPKCEPPRERRRRRWLSINENYIVI